MPAEQICKICGKIWDEGEERCPDDGGALLAAVRPEERLGEVIDDKLTLRSVVARGGMGVVYRAWQHSVEREVAVKLLHPGFASDTNAVRRFLQEARAASRLNHPNVVTVFDFGQSRDGDLYLVMELLQGHELWDEIVACGRLSAGRAVHIVTQVCDALHHAHEQGLVHRDLKPENVFLSQGGFNYRDFVKVFDFGVAQFRAMQGLERITSPGAVCGTPAYISPEQVMSEPVDRRSDIYSVGVMLFELLAGRLPFLEDQPMRQLMAHVSREPPMLTDACPEAEVPAALDVVVRRCMEKNPDRRPQTALALAQELVDALRGGLETPEPDRPDVVLAVHDPDDAPMATASPRIDPVAPTLDGPVALRAPTIADRPRSLPELAAASPQDLATLDEMPVPRRRGALFAAAGAAALAALLATLWPKTNEPAPPSPLPAPSAVVAPPIRPASPAPPPQVVIDARHPEDGVRRSPRPIEATATLEPRDVRRAAARPARPRAGAPAPPAAVRTRLQGAGMIE